MWPLMAQQPGYNALKFKKEKINIGETNFTADVIASAETGWEMSANNRSPNVPEGRTNNSVVNVKLRNTAFNAGVDVKVESRVKGKTTTKLDVKRSTPYGIVTAAVIQTRAGVSAGNVKNKLDASVTLDTANGDSVALVSTLPFPDPFGLNEPSDKGDADCNVSFFKKKLSERPILRDMSAGVCFAGKMPFGAPTKVKHFFTAGHLQYLKEGFELNVRMGPTIPTNPNLQSGVIAGVSTTPDYTVGFEMRHDFDLEENAAKRKPSSTTFSIAGVKPLSKEANLKLKLTSAKHLYGVADYKISNGLKVYISSAFNMSDVIRVYEKDYKPFAQETFGTQLLSASMVEEAQSQVFATDFSPFPSFGFGIEMD